MPRPGIRTIHRLATSVDAPDALQPQSGGRTDGTTAVIYFDSVLHVNENGYRVGVQLNRSVRPKVELGQSSE